VVYGVGQGIASWKQMPLLDAVVVAEKTTAS
jgi:hypothetical protein